MAIRIPIISEFQGGGVDKAIRQFEKLETTGQKLQFGLKKALLPAVALTAGIGALGVKAFSAAENAATANDRIREIATSMGLFGEGTENAGTSVEELTGRLTKLADATALQTGLDQNQIKLTQAKLLTFAELATTADEVGGAFDRATMAAIDMAAAGFGEASMNAVQLGKALNDPIKGITALTRNGITFTDEQKNLIASLVESGKMLEAQDLILGAIETQVGGTAKATANSSAKMKVAFSQLQEKLGKGLLPIVEKLLPLFTSLFDFFANNTGVVLAFAAVIGTLSLAIIGANTAMSIYNGIAALTKILNLALASSFTVLQVATGVGVFLALIAALVALEAKFGILSKAVKFLGQVFEPVKNALIAGVKLIAWYFETYFNIIKTTVTTVFNAIKRIAIGPINFLINLFRGMKDRIVGVWDAISEAGSTAFDAVTGTVKAVLNGIIGAFESALNFLIRGVNTAIRAYNKIPLAPNFDEISEVTLPRLAEGGIVTGPTIAMIGERGPEAVIPLNGRNAVGNITINVAGSVTSERDLVEAIRRGLVDAQRSGASLLYVNAA